MGSVAPLAQCRDWAGGNRDERLATIEDIREQINLKDSAVQTPSCPTRPPTGYSTATAGGPTRDLRLYKLYARADSFAAFAED